MINNPQFRDEAQLRLNLIMLLINLRRAHDGLNKQSRVRYWAKDIGQDEAQTNKSKDKGTTP